MVRVVGKYILVSTPYLFDHLSRIKNLNYWENIAPWCSNLKFCRLLANDGCVESRPEYCAKNAFLCHAAGFEGYMKEMCPRTCGYCLRGMFKVISIYFSCVFWFVNALMI